MRIKDNRERDDKVILAWRNNKTFKWLGRWGKVEGNSSCNFTAYYFQLEYTSRVAFCDAKKQNRALNFILFRRNIRSNFIMKHLTWLFDSSDTLFEHVGKQYLFDTMPIAESRTQSSRIQSILTTNCENDWEMGV